MKFTSFNYIVCSLNSVVQPKFFGLALLLTTVCFAGNGYSASVGALDKSFGNRGTASLSLGGMFQDGGSVAVQSDGKYISAGSIQQCEPTCNYNIALIRYNADGTLDTTFGTNGSVITDYLGQNDFSRKVAIQPDGKIVVAAGAVFNVDTSTNVRGFKLFRYLPNGTLDSTFGNNGIVYEGFGGAAGYTMDMFIEPDGKIVVAGTNVGTNSFYAFYMTRFNTNGTSDTTFGTNGKIILTNEFILFVQIDRQSNGKIVVAASTQVSVLKLLRYNSNGTLDTSFGTGGKVSSSFNGRSIGAAVAVQPDGKIIISGMDSDPNSHIPPLRRFNEDGSVDSGFVPNHGVITNNTCENCTQRVVKVLLSPDGKFYLAGFYTVDSQSPERMSVSRYLSNGKIDRSYGFRGSSFFNHTNVGIYRNLVSVSDALLQADGKVVFSGTGGSPVAGGGQRAFITKLTSTITPPSMRGDFDGDRKTDFAVYRPSIRYWFVLKSSSSSFQADNYGAGGDELVPGDYNDDLITDLSVYRPANAVWYISPSLPSGGGTGSAPFGNAGDIRLPEDYDGDGYTDLAVFNTSNGDWKIRYSQQSTGSTNLGVIDKSVHFGLGTDIPVPADYDGDGQADIAVFRPSEGNWYILRSSDDGFTAVHFGLGTDKLVPGDYDGDGKLDVAVYRPSDGAWYIYNSSDGSFRGQHFGTSEDTPIPVTFTKN